MERSIPKMIEDSLGRAGIRDVRANVDESGNAQLTGTVSEVNELAIAIAVARTTIGVTGVTNRISVAS